MWAIWYFSGLLTIPVIIGVGYGLTWAFSKTTGSPEAQSGSSCYVCKHAPAYDIGDRTNIRASVGRLWHNWVWAKRRWHKAAWENHPVHPSRVRMKQIRSGV